VSLHPGNRAAAAALALTLSACWVPLERGRQMEARLDRLESDSAEQSRRIDDQQKVVKDRVATLDQKLVEVQKKIDELNQAARRSGADLGVQLSHLQEDFTRVQGQLEVATHDLEGLKKQLEAIDDRTEKRFAALKGRGALDQAEAKERIASLSRPDDKAAFLALAQKEEAQGDKGVARELYDEYVRRWPADAAAAEAAFRSGELSTEKKRWREAVVSYGFVYEKAPRSDHAPDAMLGMAQAMLELDDLKKDAPAVLRELVEKYPKSPAAARARAQLAEIANAAAEKKKPAAKKK
jgi:TolA-binding protein